MIRPLQDISNPGGNSPERPTFHFPLKIVFIPIGHARFISHPCSAAEAAGLIGYRFRNRFHMDFGNRIRLFDQMRLFNRILSGRAKFQNPNLAEIGGDNKLFHDIIVSTRSVGHAL